MGQGLTVVNLAFFVLFLEKLHIPHSLILFDNGGAVNLSRSQELIHIRLFNARCKEVTCDDLLSYGVVAQVLSVELLFFACRDSRDD